MAIRIREWFRGPPGPQGEKGNPGPPGYTKIGNPSESKRQTDETPRGLRSVGFPTEKRDTVLRFPDDYRDATATPIRDDLGRVWPPHGDAWRGAYTRNLFQQQYPWHRRLLLRAAARLRSFALRS